MEPRPLVLVCAVLFAAEFPLLVLPLFSLSSSPDSPDGPSSSRLPTPTSPLSRAPRNNSYEGSERSPPTQRHTPAAPTPVLSPGVQGNRNPQASPSSPTLPLAPPPSGPPHNQSPGPLTPVLPPVPPPPATGPPMFSGTNATGGSDSRRPAVNLGKKLGLVFVALLIVLQILIGVFLVYKERQIAKNGYQRGLAFASPSELRSAN